jgi:hypothetical protein
MAGMAGVANSAGSAKEKVVALPATAEGIAELPLANLARVHAWTEPWRPTTAALGALSLDVYAQGTVEHHVRQIAELKPGEHVRLSTDDDADGCSVARLDMATWALEFQCPATVFQLSSDQLLRWILRSAELSAITLDD